MRDWRHNNSVRTPYFGSCGVLMMYTSQIYTFMLYTSSLLMWYRYVGDMGGFGMRDVNVTVTSSFVRRRFLHRILSFKNRIFLLSL